MKTFSVLLASAFFAAPDARAQFSDDFSDGNVTESPVWHGTTGNFIVNSDYQLQLSSGAAGTSWLSAEFSASTAEFLEWEFFIKQSFAPSGANFGRIYLMSDQADLTGPLNGYYLQFGEAGSDDAVELFRQSGTERRSVCRATDGTISAAFQIGLRITYAEGVWKVSIDYNGGSNYVLEAVAFESTQMKSSYFGIVCTHTVTNATRFYFDNFTLRRSVPPDTTPPEIASLSFTASNSIAVCFTEEVQQKEAENPLHYFAAPEPGHPVRAVLSEDGGTVGLTFGSDFTNGHEMTLSVTDVADRAGNVMALTAKKILYFVAAPVSSGDVVITEIFPDPVPQVGLPAAEFVEIFNRSPNPVQLEGWTFSDGASIARLPAHILLPAHYLTLCPPAALEEYARLGPTLVLSNFPTLNNEEDRLALLTYDLQAIDSVHYNASWYKDDDKAAGGWTLERIDTDNFCGDERNWRASEDRSGGTPGRQNSIHATLPDNIGPKLLYATPIATDTLLVVFDEKLDAVIPPPDALVVTPPVIIERVSFLDNSRKSLTVKLSEAIRPGQDYTLKASGIYDCPGNELQDDFSHCTFVMPEEAGPGDVVINEILFNPRSTGVDFVEIYNRSGKTLDLQNWEIRNAGSTAGKNTVRLSGTAEATLLMRPKSYKIFTENAVVLSGEYLNGRPETFWETDLPAFNDDAGAAALLSADGLLIDSMRYVEEMHSPFLKEKEGVSLERISPSAAGAEPANWHSGSSATGYASPGYRNSTARGDLGNLDERIVVEPEIIQPMTGAANFARIKFRFERAGLMANVSIFDSEGRPIRHIAENELLGKEGFFRWDGDRDNGAPARMGYYLVWFEVFDAEGFVKTYKKRIAVY